MSRPRPVTTERTRTTTPHLTALALGVALVSLWVLTHLTATGQRVDEAVWALFDPWHEDYLGRALFVRQWVPLASAVLATALGLRRLLLGHWRTVLLAALVPLVSAGTAELLKLALPRPDLGGFGFALNSFPSSNVAVVAGLWIAIWRLAPGPAVVLAGSGLTGATLIASMVTTAHRPSDVLGGVLLALGVHAAVRLAEHTHRGFHRNS